MARVPLHYVDIRAFCYATEDDKRVADALRAFLPAEQPIERAGSEGHHGDRILVLSARIENADGVRTVLSAVADLPEKERTRVREQLGERVTENCEFYLTFDKQAAFDGRIRLGDGITLRGKVEAYPATRDGAIENAREALAEL